MWKRVGDIMSVGSVIIIPCPNHEGNWDCTPFCKICEGEQEYKWEPED